MKSNKLSTGSITDTDKKCWQFIRDLNSVSDERLDSPALTDGKLEYTYRRMFRRWDLYAEVFSALGISEENGSRTAMTGTPAAETVIAFYALNMTGSSVSMVHMSDLKDPARWRRIVKEEGISDLVLADSLIDPKLLERIVREYTSLGLRRIIVLQIPLCEEYLSEEESLKRKSARRRLRDFKGVVFMDELLKRYEAYEICFGKKRDKAAVITHTSGTVSGIHKPVPLSDKGLNAAAASFLNCDRFRTLRGRAVSMLFMDMSSAYAMTDMVHLPLAFGGRLVLSPGVRYIEDIAGIIEKNRVNVLFATGAYMDALMKMKARHDFSALEFVFIGGSYVSAYMKGKYDAFLASCGADVRATLGYGLSETAGACILSDPEREDDSMGKPLPQVRVKLYDEDTEGFYDLSDGPQRGVLYISSPSVSSGRIGKKTFFRLEDTGDGKYLNTYDLVEADSDGYLKYAGRMDRYFVNNEGIRFDAGLVEAALSTQPGIEACAIAPGYDKSIHDTIPVMYVKTASAENVALSIAEQALVNVFVTGGLIKETNMPGQCMLTNKIPYNDGGKVDVRRFISGEVKGSLYKVEPVRTDGVLTDVILIPYADAPGRRSGRPEELG